MNNMRRLSPELQTTIQKYGEDPKTLENGIRTLKEWISKQSHLANNVRTDDQWLASFLRGSKYRMEMAKSKFDMYYTLRSILPILHTGMDPFAPRIQEIFKNGSVLILPKTSTPDSPRVLLCRTGIVQNFTYEEMLLYHQMIFIYLLLEDDNAVISGLETIVDVKDTPVGMAKYLTATVLKRGQVISEKSLPFRYKAINYVNVHPAGETVFTLIRKFMSEKFRKRLYINQDIDHLPERYPKSVLPKEYGGDTYTLDEIIEDTKRKIESLSHIYKDEINYKSMEEYRTDNQVSEESLFGVDGSFKQLNID